MQVKDDRMITDEESVVLAYEMLNDEIVIVL